MDLTQQELEQKAAEKLEAKTELEQAKPFSCPLCVYRAKTNSLLSRHINHFHPEIRDRTPTHLLKALEQKKNIPDMLNAVAEYTKYATAFDDKLPEDVISYLKKEDAKTQLVLRIIAIDKIQRALDIGEKIKELDKEFKAKIDDPKFKETVTAYEYLGVLERLQTIQKSELMLLKEISQLSEINLTDVIDKLVAAFGSAHFGSAKTQGAHAFQLTGVSIPDDPGERESLRNVLRSMLGGELGGPTHKNKPIDTTSTESAGSDTKEG